MNFRPPAIPAESKLDAGQRMIGIHFGVFAESLRQQLVGYRIPGKQITILQADADAISRLRVRGLITQSQADAAHEKLMKNIVAAIPKGKK